MYHRLDKICSCMLSFVFSNYKNVLHIEEKSQGFSASSDFETGPLPQVHGLYIFPIYSPCQQLTNTCVARVGYHSPPQPGQFPLKCC